MNTKVWNGAGRRVYLQEVGTRDGLQAEASFVPTADKVALVDALSDAGLAKIEVTAFVSPRAILALPSQIVKAGRRLDLHPRPADFAEIEARAHARADT